MKRKKEKEETNSIWDLKLTVTKESIQPTKSDRYLYTTSSDSTPSKSYYDFTSIIKIPIFSQPFPRNQQKRNTSRMKFDTIKKRLRRGNRPISIELIIREEGGGKQTKSRNMIMSNIKIKRKNLK